MLVFYDDLIFNSRCRPLGLVVNFADKTVVHRKMLVALLSVNWVSQMRDYNAIKILEISGVALQQQHADALTGNYLTSK